MVTNELLEAKYSAQKYLDKQAGHDLRTYISKTHQIVKETEKKHGLKFRYRQIKQSVEVSTGEIIERQKDKVTAEWKYRIRGETIEGNEVEVIAKLSPTNKLVFITVYVP